MVPDAVMSVAMLTGPMAEAVAFTMVTLDSVNALVNSADVYHSVIREKKPKRKRNSARQSQVWQQKRLQSHRRQQSLRQTTKPRGYWQNRDWR
jgi:hypothetical protein